MIDDISVQPESHSSHFELRRYADLISSHQTDRRRSLRWARNLRFLTFDDVDNEKLAEQSRPLTGQCQRCHEGVLPVPGHVCAAHHFLDPRSSHARIRERELRSFPNPCVHVKEASCPDCSHFPLFPNDYQPTRFRVRRLRLKDAKPSDLSTCNHFVAVSYCWSSSGQGSGAAGSAEPYQVIEENGIERRARASKDIIDRAVNFARQNGLRMIWIDQVGYTNMLCHISYR
jgi:hypothetical protein